MPKSITSEAFINRAIIIHGNTYDYSSTVFVNFKTPISIVCNQHGVFTQRPRVHLNGGGCPACKNQKRKNTNIKKYGVENISQVPIIRQKIKNTVHTKYGVDNISQVPAVKQKIKDTMQTKYGVDNINQRYIQNQLHTLKNYDWLFDQYNIQNKTTIHIANQLNVCSTTVLNYLNIHNIEVRGNTWFSHTCVQWLESIMEQEGIYIQHALNKGEYQIPDTRFKVDGYCQETNTIYEFHGDCWHGNPAVYESHELCNPFSELTAGELYNRTIERETQIISLGYNLVVMWEGEYI